MTKLAGKTALVTGGGSGIGRAIVDEFINEGAEVGVLDLSQERVENLREEYGDNLIAIEGDVTSYQDNQDAVDMVIEEYGKLDTLVPNAGIYDNVIPFEEIPADNLENSFDELFGVNVLGYLKTTKAALPHLAENDKASITYTASYSSYHPVTAGTLYVAAKHAIAGIIKQLAFEFAPSIRVNGVAPGYSPSDLTGLNSLDQEDAVFTDVFPREAIAEVSPMPVPENEDYASHYVHLASDQTYPTMTGSILYCDHGLAIRDL